MMILLIFIIQQTAPVASSSAITGKDILTFAGIIIGIAWTSIAFFLSRRFKKTDDLSEEERKEIQTRREETRVMIENYKADLKNWKSDYDVLSTKYEDLYMKKMSIQIELAVIAYEHELLYSKLKPEDSELIRQRVSMFKDNLTNIAAKEKEIKDKKTDDDAKEKAPEE